VHGDAQNVLVGGLEFGDERVGEREQFALISGV